MSERVSPPENLLSATISDAAVCCGRAFLDYISTLNPERPQATSSPGDSSGEQTYEALNDELGRFRIWAGNLGVFANGHASVDYRLRNDPDIKGIIERLLRRLEQNIRSLSQPEDFADNSYKRNQEDTDSVYSSEKAFDTSDEASSLGQNEEPRRNFSAQDMYLTKVNETITNLYRITSAIKRPHSTKEMDRVKAWLERQKPEVDEQLKELEAFTEWLVERDLPKLHRNSQLRRRVVQAVIHRRQRFLYRESHAMKLQQGFDTAFSGVDPDSADQSEFPRGSGRRVEAFSTTAPSQKPDKGKAVTFLETEASTVNRKGLSTYAKSTVLSAISPSFKQGLEHVDVPPPPKLGSRSRQAVCPFCKLPVPAEVASGGSMTRWRRHVLLDVEPYVCLFRDCKLPLPFFGTKDDWINHMSWQHAKVWPCQVPGHENQPFCSPEALSAHIHEEHSNEVPLDQVPFLIEKYAKPAPDIFAFLAADSASQSDSTLSACLFCDEPETKLDAPENHAVGSFPEDSFKSIRDHIASHLETLALISLPEREDIERSVSNTRLMSLSGSSIDRDRKLSDLPPLGTLDIASDSADEDRPGALDDTCEGGDFVAPMSHVDEDWNYVFVHSRVLSRSLPPPESDPVLRRFKQYAGNKDAMDGYEDWLISSQRMATGFPMADAQLPYIPEACIDHYFGDVNRIRALLMGLLPAIKPDLISAVHISYRKVFCILLRIGFGDRILHFIRWDSLRDECLPFPSSLTLHVLGGDDDLLKIPFLETQWEFCVPKFHQGMNEQFDRKCILPILENDILFSDRNTRISKVAFDTDHDFLTPLQSTPENQIRDANVYVLKTYCSRQADAQFSTEASAFRKVMKAGISKSGLITFYGAFVHGSFQSIILAFAEKGSLSQFFDRQAPPRDIIEQMAFWDGLMTLLVGLAEIHEVKDSEGTPIFHGWHQDIKPDNILVTGSSYPFQFMISDFGSSHFKSASLAEIPMDVDSHGTRTYGAPECYRADGQASSADLPVLQGVDIWSLGCVFSEAATWLIEGRMGLVIYQERRQRATSFLPGFRDLGCFHNGSSVLDCVRVQNDLLSRYGQSGEELTEAILKRLVNQMLESASERPTAMALWAAYQEIRQGFATSTAVEEKATQVLHGEYNAKITVSQSNAEKFDMPPAVFANPRTTMEPIMLRRQVPSRYKHLWSKLRNRHHMFLIDDDVQMCRAERGDFSELVGQLEHMTEEHRKTAPATFYFNPQKGKKDDSDAISERFVDFVSEQLASITRKNANGIPSLLFSQAMTIYILTRATWLPECSGNFKSLLADFAQTIGEMKVSDSHVRLQFIYFGDKPEHETSLDRLCSETNTAMYLVDWEPADGNIFKMLLGSFDTGSFTNEDASKAADLEKNLRKVDESLALENQDINPPKPKISSEMTTSSEGEPAEAFPVSGGRHEIVPAYRLDWNILGKWLRTKFGPYSFQIRLRDDSYHFWAPRNLTWDERDEILDLRW